MQINLDAVSVLLSLLRSLLFKHSITLFVLTAAAASSIDSLALGTPPDATHCRLSQINQHRLQPAGN